MFVICDISLNVLKSKLFLSYAVNGALSSKQLVSGLDACIYLLNPNPQYNLYSSHNSRDWNLQEKLGNVRNPNFCAISIIFNFFSWPHLSTTN